MEAKPCPYCDKFLTVNPRVRKQRKTCGSPSCQKALNRDNSARWRQEHPNSCHPDYPRVKLWLQKHAGYLQRYRQTHPAYIEKNRQAQRLRDRRKKLHLDIRNKIKNQPPEIIDQLFRSSDLDIQNVSERSHRDEIDGILVTLPNFGDERAVSDTIRLSELNVPVLVHAFNDDESKMTIKHRRDSFCGKMSACNNLRQYGIRYSLTRLLTVNPGNPSFQEDLVRFAGTCRVVRRLKHARVGALGARPAAFNTVRYSEKLLE